MKERRKMICEGCGGYDVCGCSRKKISERAARMVEAVLPRPAVAQEHYHLCMTHLRVASCTEAGCVHPSEVNVACADCNAVLSDAMKDVTFHEPSLDPLQTAGIWFARSVEC
jgi:hypothetical protein